MRIAYVAKHSSGGNDDEGAIAHALRQLGHEVLELPESVAQVPEADLLLFHKWYEPHALKAAPCRRKVFWYFDLVDWPECSARSAGRVQWMKDIVPRVDTGFCTDGDWCKKHNLHWLAQGADGRYVNRAFRRPETVDLLFTGNAVGGEGRASWVQEMRSTYGDRFVHFRTGMYGVDLAKCIGNSKIVLAPDAPVSDLYWSNRVYLTLGYGGFMLHPYCAQLRQHYDPVELVMYKSRTELHDQIRLALENPWRHDLAQAGYERTVKEHLYIHRCAQLLEVLKCK